MMRLTLRGFEIETMNVKIEYGTKTIMISLFFRVVTGIFIYLHGMLVEETGIPGANHRPSVENLISKYTHILT